MDLVVPFSGLFRLCIFSLGLSAFLLTDENSTNGVYMGKRRLKSVSLRHGDTFTLAPPDLANCVTISYYCPPPPFALPPYT